MALRDEIDKLLGKNAESLTRLIMINVIVFVVANVISIIPPIAYWVNYVTLPPTFSQLAHQPWSLFTYMFVHTSFLHILFNMLWLYWIGIIFSDFLGQRRLVYTYILGGIAGGLLYLVVSTLFPQPSLGLLGASAGIMAIIIAAAMLVPDYELMLLLFGRVKLKYLAAAAFILTSIINLNENTGGKISHIGGALYGTLFMWQYRKGTDISGGFGDFITGIGGIFKRKKKKKMSVKSRGNASSASEKSKRVDEILDKISRSGYDSLSKEEKEFLFKQSKENKP